MNKTALLHEAKQQQAALQQLSLWETHRHAALFLRGGAGLVGNRRQRDCVSRAAYAAWLSRWPCAVCAAVIGRGIRNGNRNVANILSAAEQA